MDFSQFDTRNYPTVSAKEGYGEWAATYESVVLDVMDLRLLKRLQTVDWKQAAEVADLACGTGRIGIWLKQQGIGALDGVDLTPEMLEQARMKGIYRELFLSDIRQTPLRDVAYDLVTVGLADEHLPDLRPLYAETARVAKPGAHFVLVGYHSFFSMMGMPTHYDRPSGESVAVETYVHLFSDHVRAASAAGWALRELHEGLIDDEFIALKPKWEKNRNRPFSFAVVWEK
jgi:ubiquinone/menaquinone biosynthesis C-methylase UbiE